MVISLTGSHKSELWALCFILFFEQINYGIHVLLMAFGLPNSLTTEILLIVKMILLLHVILRYRKKFLYALKCPALMVMLYLLSWVTLGDNFHYVAENVGERLFLYCLPVYICVYLIGDYTDIEKTLNGFCTFILSINAVAILIQNLSGNVIEGVDYQSISYGLLIPFIFFVWEKKITTADVVRAAIALVLLFLFGGRSGIACAFVCVLARALQNAKKNKAWIVLVTVGGMVLLLFYKQIIDKIITVISNNGYSGSLAKYSQFGDVFSDSGRMMIYEIAVEVIKDAPWLGHGLGADRFYLGEYGFKYGNYPHNLFLELMIHFGVIAGSIILIVLFRAFYRIYKKREKHPELYTLFGICFFSTGFLVLLFSSSYLVCPMVFAVLAIISKIGFSKSITFGRVRL